MTAYRFLSAALAEVESAIRWYASRTSVAADFVAAVERAITSIRERPSAWQRWPGLADQVRTYALRRFPYAIVYLVEPDEIVVLAVAHASRRPGYWKERLT